MAEQEITKGTGRTKVCLSAQNLGDGLVVTIYNEYAHIGAVAVGEYYDKENRASTSVITRLGHKDDAIAKKTAYLISRKTKRPCCVIAGVHLEDITGEEIGEFLKNADSLVEDFLMSLE
ncbi:hypothetical protein ACFL0H_03440 [Thermodesulfobacteriota bacterium]